MPSPNTRRLRRRRRFPRQPSRPLSRRHHRSGSIPDPHHARGGRPRAARSGDQSALARRPDAPRLRGAAEIAQTVDNFFAYAALADVVDDRQFDLLFDATIGDEAVRDFLTSANPDAADAIARRFEEAIPRGLWTTRRNSVSAIMTALRKPTP